MRGYSDTDLKMLAVRKGLSELARLISKFSPILENYMTVLAELEKRNIVKKHADGTYSILT